MKLEIEPYETQRARWPREGRHILAQFDDDTVIVYQAYGPAIALPAIADGRFGAGFSLTRMSWIKPNFLWMMYRCGWASKPGQEHVLAVRLPRPAFDEILRRAVPTSFWPHRYADRQAWQRAGREATVRLQWDPDHGPGGEKLERRAIQLGLRGATLAAYAQDWIVEIVDVTAFARAQREAWHRGQPLQTPREDVYPVGDPALAAALGLSSERSAPVRGADTP